MRIIINPGAGDVPNANSHDAARNIEMFADDLRARGCTVSVVALVPYNPEGGRWPYGLTCDGVEHDVDMPGLPLEQVRYLGWPKHNPFEFTRLYVDGSSWLWKFGLDQLMPEGS